ncbi:MAG: hypothetical protein RIG63_01120 [Coleofasciculus chthonoplastes F3-SA18-01]|uniref:hypothetical protein n=1 Tax=Coleofasciculus chthonoplastes TaxID=64178 RepID=UPI0033019DDD
MASRFFVTHTSIYLVNFMEYYFRYRYWFIRLVIPDNDYKVTQAVICIIRQQIL